MKRLALLSVLPTLLAGLSAQSNIVAGLDGRLTVIDNLTYYGRRGPTYPNGEIGMAMLNTMCNPGSVQIPWYQAMQPNHPKFGFIIARVHNDKIEQINEWSFCKHAFISTNSPGGCGPCQSTGALGGQVMGINCSDTYGAGNNSDRTWLGPPEEIDPWLGTWNPVGSYFDIGDPMQAGFPAPADGTRSLSQSIFDSVDNRVTVDEIDLTTAGASYYYALQLIHEGEALASRDDNNAHRGMTPTWNGSTWNFANNSEGQDYGSVLDRWPGATVNFNSNGSDDGRFYVACKVTALGGGNYHYEYAVHNVDNSRAGAALRVPIDASAVASNFTFGDIDTDTSNDWSAARIGNEIVFAATSTNPLEWNTFYNFGFDANFAPGLSQCAIDEARPGQGASFVLVQTEVPGGSTIASFAKFGSGCPTSAMANVGTCQSANAAGGALLNTTSPNDYCYRVSNPTPATVLSFDLFTHSIGGPVTVPAYIYDTGLTLPGANAIATGTITIGTTPGFYRATFANPVAVNGHFFIGVDSTQQNVVLSDLSAGGYNLGYTRTGPSNLWAFQLMRSSWQVQCTNQPLFPTPAIDSAVLPLIGTTYNLTLADGMPSSLAVLISGLSGTGVSGVPLVGAPGCDLYATPAALALTTTDALGLASSPISIPNSSTVIGITAYHQWGVLDVAANQLGLVLSDAGVATVGQ